MMPRLCCLFAVAATTSGCGASLLSGPAVAGLEIDGRPEEWDTGELAVLGGSLTVGLQHEEQRLYVYLSTGDPRILQMLSQSGMTIWL